MSVMARAFIDDSGSGGDSRYYVLGGYSASIEEWEQFSDLWQAELDRSPSIRYFKMREAESLRRQFSGWSAEARDAKVNALIDVIYSCRLIEASIAVPVKEFEEILRPELPPDCSDPYLICFSCLVAAFSMTNRYAGKIDFVFDQDQKNEKKARAWYPLSKVLLHNPGFFGEINFWNDEDFAPLQAADLIAWQVRRALCKDEPIRDTLRRLHADPFSWYRKVLHESDMRRMIAGIRESMLTIRGGEFPPLWDLATSSWLKPPGRWKPATIGS